MKATRKRTFKTNPHGFIPVNKMSAIVISTTKPEGHHWKYGDNIVSKLALPTIRYTGPVQFNMEGIRYGQFTVQGLYAYQNPNKNAQWVVRCACGIHETRKSKAILNPKNQNDRCHRCQRTEYLATRNYNVIEILNNRK